MGGGVQDKRYKTMWWLAMGILFLMVALYVTARSLEHDHVVWPWVRAFAEAGMIGALADWFAVVALFKHPLGVPIPHTAIVKKQKAKIGEGLGRFVRGHFLTPEVISEQLRRNEIVKKGLEWLSKEENARKVSEQVQKQIPQFITKGSYERTCMKLSGVLCDKLSQTPIERGAGKWMVQSMHGEEFRSVMGPLLGKLADGLNHNKEWVKQEAEGKLPETKSKILSKIAKGVTKAVSGHVVNQVADTLEDASDDITHPFFDKLEVSLHELGVELQEDGEHTDWARWRRKVFQNPGTVDAMEALLVSAGDLVAEDQEYFFTQLWKSLSKFAHKSLADPEAIKMWEEQIITYLNSLSDSYGDAFEELINDRFAVWEGDALSKKLESSIGADLQFIRINGSLIGGMIGLALHGIGLLIWG